MFSYGLLAINYYTTSHIFCSFGCLVRYLLRYFFYYSSCWWKKVFF